MAKTLRNIVVSTVISLFLLVSTASADKSAVSLSVPEAAKKGEEITIKVTVTHSANNFLHYTDWVYVMANGKEIMRWDYSWRSRPESNIFVREVKYVVNGPLEIAAQSDCNIHGSKGVAKASLKVTE